MSRVTRVGFLQLVPAEEGSFFLLAEVGALLQEPVGDPTLTDPWTDRETERQISSSGERGREAACDCTHLKHHPEQRFSTGGSARCFDWVLIGVLKY